MKIIRDVIEGKEYGDCLFFNFNSYENNIVKYTFFPRPYDGRDYLKGFCFLWEVDPNIDGWEYFYNTVLLDPEFIQCFWVDYRLGFNPEKYWFKVIDLFSNVFDDCPYGTNTIDFGRKIIPKQYKKDVLRVSGINIDRMEAWDEH